MDPAMQPINGISLERYAELGAAVSDVQDNPAEVARVLQQQGVSQADFEAAKAGWTARMQDYSLMGRVAMAYMPLYQAALARRKGGAASISYEDFVAVSAAIKAYGFEAAVQACGISQSDWTEAAGQWNNAMAREMGRYAGHHGYVSQEEARLRSGGPPKRVQVTRTQGVPDAVSQNAAAASAAAAGAVNPYAAAMGAGAMPGAVGAYGGGMNAAMAAAMANPVMQQAGQAQAAIAQNPIGHAAGLVGAALTGGILPGTRVLVAWSDGNYYRAQVICTAPSQYQVQFDNGAQQWVPAQCVRKA
jgi:hypothetical protein